MAAWIEVPAHRIYAICACELRDGFDYLGEKALKFPTVSSERRTAKFLSGARFIPQYTGVRVCTALGEI